MSNPYVFVHLCCLAFACTLGIIQISEVSASDFDPYQLNGGLVAAVASKDFVVIASDTRFMGEGGYDILSRNHVTSRLWVAGSDRLEVREGWAFRQSHHPTFIGSAGCNADCEALKRTIRAQVREANEFVTGDLPVNQIATLLSQVLYSRRGFPFYSFCIVAGMSEEGGRAFVYDAIGSFEEVAVATVGTGRELLQPVLDGKFRSSDSKSKQVVACTTEEAVAILVNAYRSISEREIGVGDNLVLCILTKSESIDHENSGGCIDCHVKYVALKQQ